MCVYVCLCVSVCRSLFGLETGSHVVLAVFKLIHIAEDDLQPLILLSLPPRHWIAGLKHHPQFIGVRDQIKAS